MLRLLLQSGHVCHFSLHPLGHVSLRMLVQVVFPRESLSALLAREILVTRVDNVVTGEVLVALEALHTDGADKGPLGGVASLVLVQVLFSFQCGTAILALEPAFKFVSAHVLIQLVSETNLPVRQQYKICWAIFCFFFAASQFSIPVGVGHVALRAAEKSGPVERCGDSDFTRSVFWLLLFDFGFASAPLLTCLKHFAERSSRIFCLDVGFVRLHDDVLRMRGRGYVVIVLWVHLLCPQLGVLQYRNIELKY